MDTEYSVAAFYRFTPLLDPGALRAPLLAALDQLHARGTVLLAPEGINGTLSVPERLYDDTLSVLRALPGCEHLQAKRSTSQGHAFRRLKVRLKREIVTLGVPGVNPSETVGTYVAPHEWNALITDPDTLVVDTRNTYEVRLGTFKGAKDPGTETFGAFPEWLEQAASTHNPKRIAMFCTGGIRCEKATSYAKKAGLGDVYHLDGGILAYLKAIPEPESLWRGECFVFDERVALTHGLAQGKAVICRACKFPVSALAQDDPRYVSGVSCPECFDKTSAEQKARFMERQHQVDLAEARGQAHLAGK
ncbi:MAG: rhodanese-related sulfurtransferase [Pseudomonadota bacterium]